MTMDALHIILYILVVLSAGVAFGYSCKYKAVRSRCTAAEHALKWLAYDLDKRIQAGRKTREWRFQQNDVRHVSQVHEAAWKMLCAMAERGEATIVMTKGISLLDCRENMTVKCSVKVLENPNK